uniref:5-formyltetrahydrofolate cyclo-ligase n=1 Tax=Strongyloides venezuelensis TaxID=75913 RepID=A0A0K0FMA9_STRVS
MSIRLAKSKLRKEVKLILRSIDRKDILEESQNIISQIFNDPIYKSSKAISIFVSTPTEVKTDQLIENSLKNGKTVFIPYFEKNDDRMEMLILPSIDIFYELPKNSHGIRQYDSGLLRKVSSIFFSQPQDNFDIKNISYTIHGPLNLIICPLLAASKDGCRLGYGKGYYDKFLNEHFKIFSNFPTTYGLALSCQIREKGEIPMEDFDYKLDKIFYRC